MEQFQEIWLWLTIYWKAVGGTLLSLFPIAWVGKMMMRKLYPQADMMKRIVLHVDQTGPSLYMNNNRHAITGMYLRVWNFWQFRLEFNPMVVRLAVGDKPFGKTDAVFNPRRIRHTETSQIKLSDYNLRPSDLKYLEKDRRKPGCANLSIEGALRFTTWLDIYEVPFAITMRMCIYWSKNT